MIYHSGVCYLTGIKEVNSEVEKFVTANSQELGKDKWLCPLSGKKFKVPNWTLHLYKIFSGLR